LAEAVLGDDGDERGFLATALSAATPDLPINADTARPLVPTSAS
jgi:hypothetical protein